ncbi:flagellar hook assembly protein FlgD [Fodinibius sp. Rm-B-1B1-1]|uniref:flagellar hook assembly protein FlgD n=1 Tax=Fodinibius alkaliphilus TaxID=3140241 RepID=UPI00315A4EA1
MDIGQVDAQTQLASQNEKSLTGNNKMGQDQFLQLLVAQMQNQDPINPMDGKEFASQLAQFNSVEQLIGVNDGLEQLSQSQQMMRTELTNSMASSLTGKNVRALSNKVNLGSGEGADVNYDLNNTASEVEIVIRDSSGNEVRRETIDGASAGEHNWKWDGKTNDGVDVPDGQYNVEINATNGDESVKARTFIEGTANKVRFTGEGVKISIDGVEVPIGDIETVAVSDK